MPIYEQDGWKVHHKEISQSVQERLDELNEEYPNDPQTAGWLFVDFMVYDAYSPEGEQTDNKEIPIYILSPLLVEVVTKAADSTDAFTKAMKKYNK